MTVAKRTAPDAGIIEEATDRRGEQRTTISLYRSAIIVWENAELLCLVRNVSSGGMMGKVLLDVPVGARILVEMRSGHRIDGTVKWARERLIGVQFDTFIDVNRVMNGAHRVSQSWRQRMPRVHAGCPATLRTVNGTQAVTMRDLSQGGAKIEGDWLRVGDDVTLAVKGLDPRRATVRWVRGGMVGLTFIMALPFDTLARWALDRQAELGLLPNSLPQDTD